MSIKETFVSKFWDIANYITGFAVAQSLTFAFLFLKTDKIGNKLAGQHVLLKMILFLSIGCILYMIGVWWSVSRARNILKSTDADNYNLLSRPFKQSVYGRCIAILFFTILDISILLIVC